MDLEKKKEKKADLIDENLVSMQNRLYINKIKVHEFNENGKFD
jgi:hypothetical protein